VLVKNRPEVEFRCCKYEDQVGINISNLIHHQVGKLHVFGGTIETLIDELLPFTQSKLT